MCFDSHSPYCGREDCKENDFMKRPEVLKLLDVIGDGKNIQIKDVLHLLQDKRR